MVEGQGYCPTVEDPDGIVKKTATTNKSIGITDSAKYYDRQHLAETMERKRGWSQAKGKLVFGNDFKRLQQGQVG